MSSSRVPAGLSLCAKRLWRAVTDEFELSPAELELLRSTLTALDRADQAAAVITAEGLTTTDRYGGARSHPAVDIEGRNRALFARGVAQLGIKATSESVQARVGAKPGPRARAARPRGR
jgi:hypothetical protein